MGSRAHDSGSSENSRWLWAARRADRASTRSALHRRWPKRARTV